MSNELDFSSPAIFSPDRKYRYFLRRVVSIMPGTCMFIMMNPSTADENIEDPTVRRCMNYVRDWGYGELWVTNIFAYRATNPADMLTQENPIGPDNMVWIATASKLADSIVCAWGGVQGTHEQGQEVMKVLDALGEEPQALAVTNAGDPRHPLYLKKILVPRAIPYLIEQKNLDKGYRNVI